MLIALININYDTIDTVCMRNLGTLNSKGEHKYNVWLESEREKGSNTHMKVVWHKREDGWSKLLQKTLRSLQTQRRPTIAEDFANDIKEIIKRSGVELKKGMNPKSKSQARRMVEQSRNWRAE